MNFVTIIVLLISGVILFIILLTYFFFKRKIRIDISKQNFTSGYSDRIKLFFGSYIEKLSISYGLNLPVLLGLDDLWINLIKKRGNKKEIVRVLKYSPDKSLFTIMTTVLKKPGLRPVLSEWIDKSGEFLVLRKIALSGNGEEFDGKGALKFFSNNVDEINEMMGDFEWKSRYFAVNILIHDKGERSRKAVWESFRDPSVLVRITAVRLFNTVNREKLYKILESLILNDPSFVVRKAARERITRDLQDLYKIAPFELEITQQLHLIELLNPESKQDENIAIEFMKTGNKELELYASRFLSNNGSLRRLFLSADPGYAKGFEDTYSILQIAVGVDCTTFIDLSDNNILPGSLLLASRILIRNGNRNIITDLIQKVINLSRNRESIHPYREIYENSMLCTCKRGNDAALILLNSEIKRRKYDYKFQEWILDKLPKNRENIFVPTLLDFLKDEKYKSKVELKKALIQFPVFTVLPEIIDILRSENDKLSHSIRMEAIKLLGALQLPHCTQYILENLSILPLEEAKQYSQLLIENDTQTFRDKVKNILSFGDAASMAHLIAALPETECKSFLPEIKQALKNSNPDVRVAAVWALTDYNKGEFLSSCFKLLRDPVEHVRKEVGKTLGIIANPETILVLKQTLFDKNESLPVKSAVLHGLAVSDSKVAIDIILSKLEENIELVEESIITLSKKDSQEEVIKILNFMDKTTPVIRENIIKAIKLMGDKVETIIEELLFKESKILHKHAVSILEDSGIIDLRIRQLAHRNPIIRKKAAEFLMMAGTKAAYRGIILAAKDPAEEIRIQVVRALDHLNSPLGLPILEELKNDPEKRVKKYTLWALERYEAKKLV